MTKSQNTKNEQQKDLCITSEQLTEQWKLREDEVLSPGTELIAEYPTWQEAVNSKEFNQ